MSLLGHAVAHAVAEEHAKWFMHGPAVPELQFPVPLQVPAGVSMLLVHEAAPHAVLVLG
jgi:hypothetical protein